MGDINADILRPTVYPGKEMLNSFALAGTRPPSLITPTRITSKSTTCIDIIAVNEDIQVKSYSVIPSATSDHFPVTAVIVSTFPDKVKPVIKRSFNKVDFEALSQRVADIDISTYLDSPPDTLLEQLQTKFVEILDDVTRIRKFPMRRHRSPWLTSEMRQLIRHWDYLAKQLKIHPGSAAIEADLKTAKRRVKSRIRREAKLQGSDAHTSTNPTDSWNFIKMVTFTAKGGNDNLPPLHILNDHFATVVQDTNDNPHAIPSGCNRMHGFH